MTGLILLGVIVLPFGLAALYIFFGPSPETQDQRCAKGEHEWPMWVVGVPFGGSIPCVNCGRRKAFSSSEYWPSAAGPRTSRLDEEHSDD